MDILQLSNFQKLQMYEFLTSGKNVIPFTLGFQAWLHDESFLCGGFDSVFWLGFVWIWKKTPVTWDPPVSYWDVHGT